MSEQQRSDRYVPEERYDQLLDVLKHRRAVRGYEDRPVEEEKIDKLLSAARWAPSGANSQPWEFVVVTDDDTITDIGDIYVEYYDDQYAAEDPGFPVDNKRWMRDVPTYIVPVGDTRLKQAYPLIDGEEHVNEEIFQHSLANAIYAIWLAATTQGLSTTSATCFSHHRQRLRELLDIPEFYDIPATLPIGYPRKYQDTRYRQELSELVHTETFDRTRVKSDEDMMDWIEQTRRSRYRGDGERIPRDELDLSE